jgi:hypothetical protein
LDVVTVDNFSTVRATSNHILSDDPFHKVHVFRPVDDPIEFLPIPHDLRIIPPPHTHVGIPIEAVPVEAVTVERMVSPDLEPVQRVAPAEICPELGELRQREVWVVDSLCCVDLMAFSGPLHNSVRGEVAGAVTLRPMLLRTDFRPWNCELNVFRIKLVELVLERTRRRVIQRCTR